MSYERSGDYWDSFYSRVRVGVPTYPSQFAAFAINEFSDIDGIIEFGCGNGRDSDFFAANGFNLLAVDASAEAIDLCRARNQFSHARFVQSRSADVLGEVSAFLVGRKKVAVYARFFLHAVEEAEERDLLVLLGGVLPAGSRLFFEYRTTDDANREKVFGDGHFRRYLEHRVILARIEAAGFLVEYEIEGRGLAKYRDEDARVGRCVALKK